mmetsp:Transcript_3365/g.11039  ORF Transcript_3365/g.11039 Transcript_3365/m.11039 type:complete len:94 (-) Transcript_3365:419-700(-)
MSASVVHQSDWLYDTVDLDDMDYHEASGKYTFQCPCGDLFEISEADLLNGIDIARCPSCSLTIRVLFEVQDDESGGDGVQDERVEPARSVQTN